MKDRRKRLPIPTRQLLRQALAMAALEEGAFYVDEAGRTIYLWTAGGIDPNDAAIEVAVRPTLFAASGRANLTVSGLIFEHAATPVDESAVVFDDARNLLVEGAIFRWNNWGDWASTRRPM